MIIDPTRKAIVVGCYGQDGTLLIADLEQQGVEVLGLGRNSMYRTNKMPEVEGPVDICNDKNVQRLIEIFSPDEVYYLPAYHTSSQEVHEVSPIEEYSASHNVHVIGLLSFLGALVKLKSKCRLFYASSSLIFSGEHGEVQNEETPFSPKGIYAITKVQGMLLCREFREKYNVFASVGILYNHESHLRPDKFLSKKIIQSAIRISEGAREKCIVGDLAAKVDWGYAPDFVKAFQKILCHHESMDFVVSTGEAHTVKSFVEIAFNYFGLHWEDHVVEDKKILARRPPVKIGDNSKLKNLTGWSYSIAFPDLIKKLILDSQIHGGAKNCHH